MLHICRYYAVLKPLSMYEHRGKIMLTVAWICSAICSVPQVSHCMNISEFLIRRAKPATEINIVKLYCVTNGIHGVLLTKLR